MRGANTKHFQRRRKRFQRGKCILRAVRCRFSEGIRRGAPDYTRGPEVAWDYKMLTPTSDFGRYVEVIVVLRPRLCEGAIGLLLQLGHHAIDAIRQLLRAQLLAQPLDHQRKRQGRGPRQGFQHDGLVPHPRQHLA